MKHKWVSIQQGINGLFNYGKRQCANCGATQTKEAQHSWMKVTGYKWLPLVGRCKKQEK